MKHGLIAASKLLPEAINPSRLQGRTGQDSSCPELHSNFLLDFRAHSPLQRAKPTSADAASTSVIHRKTSADSPQLRTPQSKLLQFELLLLPNCLGQDPCSPPLSQT